MTQAIWTLSYAVDEAQRERYLDWFHGEHIPDKLSRPGYTWAAHYEHAMDAARRCRDLRALIDGMTEPCGPARLAMRIWPQ